ncbi:hypothetical protein L228DRAFT_262458 [Xylona heveae TC161]|uniref:Uncharacterized protein n=1 Tax=Xylona heveae (strain CBS 132557 / TC161) TaxID=1328760 RepID=A0A165FVU7_XYLHT|nr:hypothetical protein L228DRAFT_262458 [Xylona heveae TC161]KZF21442.1 hypothetical protein L228DRAFT_262458 [Xylona heveae TC161]
MAEPLSSIQTANRVTITRIIIIGARKDKMQEKNQLHHWTTAIRNRTPFDGMKQQPYEKDKLFLNNHRNQSKTIAWLSSKENKRINDYGVEATKRTVMPEQEYLIISWVLGGVAVQTLGYRGTIRSAGGPLQLDKEASAASYRRGQRCYAALRNHVNCLG